MAPKDQLWQLDNGFGGRVDSNMDMSIFGGIYCACLEIQQTVSVESVLPSKQEPKAQLESIQGNPGRLRENAIDG